MVQWIAIAIEECFYYNNFVFGYNNYNKRFYTLLCSTFTLTVKKKNNKIVYDITVPIAPTLWQKIK